MNFPDVYSPMPGWREDGVEQQALLANRPIENIRLIRWQGEYFRKFFNDFNHYLPDKIIIKSMLDIMMENKSDDWKYNNFVTILPYEYIDELEEKKYHEKNRKKVGKKIISTIYSLYQKFKNVKGKEKRQEIVWEIEWYEDELCGMLSDKEQEDIWLKLLRAERHKHAMDCQCLGCIQND